MPKTISTHNGSTVCRDHNIRNPKVTDKLDHIDKSLTHQNETFCDELPREAYKRIFGEALEKYNAKQSRPERRIKDYYSHIDQDAKKHPVYEMIVQIGDNIDTGLDCPVEKECLREFVRGWKERNPNLELIGAYLHADEPNGTVHLHLDYVPVARGFKKGLEVQNSLTKALEQQGFEKTSFKETAQILWERSENVALEKICAEHGIEIHHPMRDGEKEKREHLDTETYKAQKKLEKANDIVNELIWTKKEVEMEIEDSRLQLGKIQNDVAGAKSELAAAKSEAQNVHQNASNEVKKTRELIELTNTLKEKKKGLEGQISALQSQKDELERDLPALRSEKDTLERALPELKAKVSEATEELDVIESAAKKKNDEWGQRLGWDAWRKSISDEKENRKKNLLVRFAEFIIEKFPNIRQMWEHFQAEEERSKSRNKYKGQKKE